MERTTELHSSRKWQIFRNYTLEPLFSSDFYQFSGYEDVSQWDASADGYLFIYFVPLQMENNFAASKVLGFIESLKFLASSLPQGKPFGIVSLSPIVNYSWERDHLNLNSAIEAFDIAARSIAATRLAAKRIPIGDFFETLRCNSGVLHSLVDWKYFYSHQVPLNPKLGKMFETWCEGQMRRLPFFRKKLLILDLDGVLWHGVLGENEMEIGSGYPGNVFFDIQSMIARLKATGVLLAICSKNNASDVEEAFRNRPDMPLKLSDFVAIRCNWRPKAENVAEILQELSLGPESAVFLDDSPFERESLALTFQEMQVPTLSEKVYQLAPQIRNLIDQYFSTDEFSDEDRHKTELYQLRRKSTPPPDLVGDRLAQFLDSLQIKLAIQKISAMNQSRFLQLTQKTNQFNLTSKRISEFDLKSYLEGGALAYILNVSDRYGDHGLSGAALVTLPPESCSASIEIFLLSCRILGRGIEVALMDSILNILFDKGVRLVRATFIPTQKNSQTEFFYDKLGFEVSRNDQRLKEYHLNLDRRRVIEARYTVVGEDDGR